MDSICRIARDDILKFSSTFVIFYMEQGRLDDAENLSERALTGFEKPLGAEHSSTLITVGNLGRAHADQGRLSDAEKMHERALAPPLTIVI